MPPKKTLEKSTIIRAAVKIIGEKGIQEVSARKIAEVLQTSVAPIYTDYDSIEQLKKDAMLEIASMLAKYTGQQYTDKQSLNGGIGIVLFARDYPDLYSQLFIKNAGYLDIIEKLLAGIKETFYLELSKLGLEKTVLEKIVENLWIYCYGFAGLICVGLIPKISDREVIDKLTEISKTEILSAMKK